MLALTYVRTVPKTCAQVDATVATARERLECARILPTQEIGNEKFELIVG
jgi:hypothetical protein